MKKVILTKQQLNKIHESVDMSVKAPDNTSSSFVQTLTSPDTISDLNQARKTADDVNTIVSGPKSSDDKPTIDVDVPKGDTVQSAISDNPDIATAINNGASAKIHGDGYVQEAKVYSKSDIEEMRLKNIRENGIFMTKKQLDESLRSNTKYDAWTPKELSNIYGNIEMYPKGSTDYCAVKAALNEIRKRNVNIGILDECDFPSVIYKNGTFYIGGYSK